MNDRFLDRAADPAELRRMTPDELNKTAEAIRAFLVDTVSKTGGHLSGNLGVVEATLAIHRVFDMDHDRVIWDVGHQAYVHKLLRGRGSRFASLRQMDGLSGFPKTEEDPADAFDTGHSTTSISAALGMARARDLAGERHHVVAFIGDGSLTGGMAWEAMNDAGQRREKLIVILNDNEMSIARNEGGLARHLSQLRVGPWYTHFKHWVRDRVGPIPVIGRPVYETLGKIRDRTKYSLIDPRGILFEEMGWTYIGPIDGHDIARMEEVLEQVKVLEKPAIIHILTRKGRGYGPAEAEPAKFHGVGPFDAATGLLKPASGCAETVGSFLAAWAGEDPKLTAITAAMPDGFGLNAFRARYPRRFFDVAIAEPHAVTMAAGMAAAGMHPAVCIYATFLQRAYDQILEDVCLQNLPVTFCVSHSGISGRDGETHQGIYAFSFLSGIPNLTVLAASSKKQLRSMLRWALTSGRPTAVCYPKDAPEGTEDGEYEPRWRRVRGDGSAATALVAEGICVAEALGAAEKLGADVIDASVIKPLDTETLDRLLSSYDTVWTVEDMVPSGSLGAAVAAYAAAHPRRAVLHTLCLPDAFVPHGSPQELLHKYGLDSEGILRAAQKAEMAQITE